MARTYKLLCAALALSLLWCAPASAVVVVSSKLDSEATTLSQMVRLMLNANGIATIDRTRIGATPVVRRALLAGEIDLYVEYTGNAGFFFNDSQDPAWKNLDAGYQRAVRLDYDANRIVWLTPARASNAWALAVRRDVARAKALKTMSDFCADAAGPTLTEAKLRSLRASLSGRGAYWRASARSPARTTGIAARRRVRIQAVASGSFGKTNARAAHQIGP